MSLIDLYNSMVNNNNAGASPSQRGPGILYNYRYNSLSINIPSFNPPSVVDLYDPAGTTISIPSKSVLGSQQSLIDPYTGRHQYDKFNLRQSAYNTDYVKEPYIVTKIGGNFDGDRVADALIGGKNTPIPGVLAGGALRDPLNTAALTATDLVRMSKFMFSAKGIRFYGNQQLLSLSNGNRTVYNYLTSLNDPLNDTNKFFNPTSILLNTAGAPYGQRFRRQGINPFGPAGDSLDYEKKMNILKGVKNSNSPLVRYYFDGFYKNAEGLVITNSFAPYKKLTEPQRDTSKESTADNPNPTKPAVKKLNENGTIIPMRKSRLNSAFGMVDDYKGGDYVDDFNYGGNIKEGSLTDAKIINDKRDFIKFFLSGPRKMTGGAGGAKSEILVFRATLENFTDSFNAQWDAIQLLGRADPVYTYNSFDRAFNMSFKVAAYHVDEMKKNYEKLDRLAGYTAPFYLKAGVQRAPICRLTVGDYLYQQPGFINGLTYDVETSFPWEINYTDNNEGKGGIDTDRIDRIQAPMIINVNFDFQIIGEFRPENKFRPGMILNSEFLMPSEKTVDLAAKE